VLLRPAKGFSLEASYFNVDYRNRIAEPIGNTSGALNNPLYSGLILYSPTPQQVLDAVAGLTAPLLNATGKPLDPANVVAILDSRLQNVARQRARGVDVTARYQHDLGPDESLDVTASGSYLESDRKLSAAQPDIQLAGTIFDPPHWRGRAGAIWQRSNVTLSSFVSYIGGVTDNRTQPTRRVGSFTTVDTTARFRTTASAGIFHGLDLTVSVLNLFNERPALIVNPDPALPPYDSSNYPVAGRVVSITLSKDW
jgi:outer membrane receptor protein involved in Fe transport